MFKYLLTLILLSCIASNCSEELRNSPGDYNGYFRLSAGGYGEILKLDKKGQLDYLLWQDLGMYWSGFSGQYKVMTDSLEASVFIPSKSDTIWVQTFKYKILPYNDTVLLLADYSEWSDLQSLEQSIQRNKQGKVIRGIGFHAKFAPLDSFIFEDLEIEWRRVENFEGTVSPWPPVPPLPELTDSSELDTIELHIESN